VGSSLHEYVSSRKEAPNSLAFETRVFRGAFPPVDLRAVCFVRAIGRRLVSEQYYKESSLETEGI
jgi:hypothetical protein